MKVDISKFDNVEEFCKNFSYVNGCLHLSYLYKDWTDYFCSTYSKQYVMENCENYNPNDEECLLNYIIEELYDEEEYFDSCLDDD